MSNDEKYLRTEVGIWRPDYGETIEDADTFPVSKCLTNDRVGVGVIARDYAEYFYFNKDGWECEWPIKFAVADKNKKPLGTVEIHRELMPFFSFRNVEVSNA